MLGPGARAAPCVARRWTCEPLVLRGCSWGRSDRHRRRHRGRVTHERQGRHQPRRRRRRRRHGDDRGAQRRRPGAAAVLSGPRREAPGRGDDVGAPVVAEGRPGTAPVARRHVVEPRRAPRHRRSWACARRARAAHRHERHPARPRRARTPGEDRTCPPHTTNAGTATAHHAVTARSQPPERTGAAPCAAPHVAAATVTDRGGPDRTAATASKHVIRRLGLTRTNDAASHVTIPDAVAPDHAAHHVLDDVAVIQPFARLLLRPFDGRGRRWPEDLGVRERAGG
jgi:hypothetical protein